MQCQAKFLSTLSLRRATRVLDGSKSSIEISIHALLAESDASTTITTICIASFLSTLSLRRATLAVSTALQLIPLISIHALLAESDKAQSLKIPTHRISIHALLAESDKRTERHANSQQEFLSTLSLRRATAKVHKTVGYFCAYETNFMEIASSC